MEPRHPGRDPGGRGSRASPRLDGDDIRSVHPPPGDAMSTFFRALERAEQERALRRTTMPAPAPSEEAIPGAASVVPAREELALRRPLPRPARRGGPAPTRP